MKDDLILAFDAGTQSIRCGLIDLSGALVATAQVPIRPYFSTQAGFTEQEPDYYWEKFCEASRQLTTRNAGLMKRVKAVAVTAQRGTYFNLDKDGKALRPAILWLDQRRIPPVKWAPPYLETAFRTVGVFNTVDRYYRQSYSNWIRHIQPGIWEKTHKFLLQTAFFHYKLTGSFAESLGANYGYLPVDRKTFGWAKKNDLVNLLFPVEREKLPELVRQGETIGSISSQAAGETGIPEGLPLIAAAGDKMCEILGDGVINSDTACLCLGTCSAINTISDKYIELQPYLTPYPAAIPGSYLLEIPVSRGFWMVSWFKEQFGWKEEQLAGEKGLAAEALLEELAQSVPPGSQGLILQPYWFPNSAFCGEEGRGALIGFTDVHTRAHVYRAILEGVMYALRDGGEIMRVKLRKPFKALRASGGGANSKTALQIAADIFNQPVEHLVMKESGLLGAAIIAAVGLGYYPDYASALRSMVHVDRVIQPIARNHDIYAHLYERVYRRMYTRLEPLYKELKDITALFPEEMLPPAK